MAANVAVRFSVEDQEVVRKALEDLGEQGKGALKKMDDAAKTPAPAMKGLSNVIEEVRGRLIGLAVPLGPLGSGLVALGPGGIVAAGGIGAVVAAMAKMNELANELATKSSRISNFAELTGLSTDQVQALNNVTAKYGKTSEETNTVIERTAQAWDQMRRGLGDAFDQIRKIDPELLRQLTGAKDLSGALDILAQAYDKIDDKASKIDLARAFGGKGGTSTLGALLSGIADAGSVKSLTSEVVTAGDAINRELIEKLAKVSAQTKEIKERTADKFAALFADNVMQHNKEVAQDLERIVDALKYIKDNAPGAAVFNAATGQQRNPFIAETNRSARTGGSDAVAAGGLTLSDASSNRGTRTGREGDFDTAIAPGDVRIPQPRPQAPVGAVPLAVQLREMRDWVTLLGSAATAAEQYNLKELELKKAVDDQQISQDKANRALAAFKLQQDLAVEGIRERIGITSEQEILDSRMAQLRDARAKGIIRNDEELARGEQLVQREARQTADALEVRNSAFKGLKQIEVDGRDLAKSLDTGLTGSLSGVTTGLADIADGTKKTGLGFADLEKTVARSATEMAIKMAITAQIAKLLGYGLNALGIGNPLGAGAGVSANSPGGGGALTASAHGNVFSRGNIVPFRTGGIIRSPVLFPMANGGTGLAGEADDEGILPLTRINGKLGVYAAGGRGGSSAPEVQLHVHGVTNTQNVRRVQSVDGRGNQRIDLYLDQAVGAALARPGSAAQQSFGSAFGGRPIPVQR